MYFQLCQKKKKKSNVYKNNKRIPLQWKIIFDTNLKNDLKSVIISFKIN